MTLVTESKLSARQSLSASGSNRTLLSILPLDRSLFTHVSHVIHLAVIQITLCESFTVTLHEVHTRDASLTRGSSAAFPWAEREF